MIDIVTSLWAVLDLQENLRHIMEERKIFLAIRIVVAVIGAVLGWFIASPLWRGMYRLTVHKTIPLPLLIPLRLIVAGVLGAAVFLFLPLGSGGWGGLGSGGGQGDSVGPGKGQGSGDGKGTGTNQNNAAPDKGKPTNTTPEIKGPEKIDIVLLGGKDYRVQGKYVHGEGKFYKVTAGNREPAYMTLKEVEALFNEHKNYVVVSLHITGQSVSGAPQQELENLFYQRNIKYSLSK